MKDRIEEDIQRFIETWKAPSSLHEASSYALQGPAKRFRPILVHLVGQAVGKGLDVSQGALAVELWHTASLIVDDLPCMDNDGLRRGKIALHSKYGEATTLLVSYALIAAGYTCLSQNLHGHSAEVCRLAIQAVSKNTGSEGATGGQYWDLFAPEDKLEQMIAMKTGSLFELSFALGWLLGGGDVALLPIVEAAAQHYGMAFQIRDDLSDVEQDSPEKNYALSFGKERALTRIQTEMELFHRCLDQLGLSRLERALNLALS